MKLFKSSSVSSIEFYREQFDSELSSHQTATRHVIPKPRELIRMFETLDCITLIALPASFVIS